MDNLNQALDSVRNSARAFRAVIELADALEGVASIEQATHEANAALTKAQLARDTINLEVKVSKELVSANILNADSILLKARAEAEDIRGKARDELKAAEARARGTRESADQYASVAKVKSDMLMKDLDDTIKARTTELNEVTSKLDKARAKMAEMLK